MNINWTDANHGFGRFPHQVMEFGAPLMSQSCNGLLHVDDLSTLVSSSMRGYQRTRT